MTRLSVNINKVATLRNARGGNVPDVAKVALDCEHFGADGITVHPRPDERHIRYDDVRDLKPLLKTELNIEGYPNQEFIDLVLQVKPAQVTLVPAPPGVLTSNAGWNTKKNQGMLTELSQELKLKGIRSSVFVDTNLENIEYAAKCGIDRIELYTGPYANGFKINPEEAIEDYIDAAKLAVELGLGLNAGHDLDLNNLRFFKEKIIGLQEVSIGHALISDALYLGLENTIQMYKKLLNE